MCTREMQWCLQVLTIRRASRYDPSSFTDSHHCHDRRCDSGDDCVERHQTPVLALTPPEALSLRAYDPFQAVGH